MIRREDTPRLWHRETNARALGCANCPELRLCGGLSVQFGAMDCLQFCCGAPDTCDLVCVKNPDFVARMREVNGVELDLPKAPAVRHEELPLAVPMLYHPYRRERRLGAEAVALSLYDVIDWRAGGSKFPDRKALAARYGFEPGARLILDGVKRDAQLERFWGSRMDDIAKALLALAPDLVTTPNYSLFTDQPRWTNLVNLKRIAIVWHEFARHGLPTALHLNAITDTDYARWADFLGRHDEIPAISVEFGTGAGNPLRTPWHVDHLAKLADDVGRPLRLVIRGAVRHLAELRRVFHSLTVVDTTSFSKTLRRKQANIDHWGRLRWGSRRTAPGEPLDDLLAHNVESMCELIEGVARPQTLSLGK